MGRASEMTWKTVGTARLIHRVMRLVFETPPPESQRMRDGLGAAHHQKGNGVSNPMSQRTPRTEKVFPTIARTGVRPSHDAHSSWCHPVGGVHYSNRPPRLATTSRASARVLPTRPNTHKPHRNMCHDCFAVYCEALQRLLVPTVKIQDG